MVSELDARKLAFSFIYFFFSESTGEQTKGACLVPKRALRVMEGEVNRILQLTSNSVIPIMYQVPRKTYRDFHSDLYPETSGYKTDLTATQWLKGINLPVPKMSLDPAKRELGDAPIIVSIYHRLFISSFFFLSEIHFIFKSKQKQNISFSPQTVTFRFLFRFSLQSHAFPINVKIHRGTLSEMIKNETNRLVKQTKPLATITPASIHQKSTTTLISIDPIANRRPNTDNIVVQPLSKHDIIKKFDNQTKESSPAQPVPALSKLSSEETKHDEDEQAHSSNSDEFDNDSGNQSDNNNSYKNGHGNGNGNNNSGPVPPKPLPRTSRNNSITSISSDQGAALSVAPVIDELVGVVRPVAKPRTTTASYKVAICSPSKCALFFNNSFYVEL